MKQNLPLIFCLVAFFTLTGCNKSEKESAGAGTNFKFVSLSVADTLMKVNAVTIITANATGEGLTYTWTSEFGTFVGSGSSVQWTVCHADRFKITCEVKDNANHSESKDIYVRTEE